MSELSDFLSSEGYFVTDDGRVFATTATRGRSIGELKTHADKDGYLQVRLTSRFGRKTFKVHALVAEYHLGPRPSPFHEVRHLDGSRDNNHVGNLAWGTKSENCVDRSKHGRGRIGMEFCKRGHSLTEDNIYRSSGYRICRTCANERNRLAYQAKSSLKNPSAAI